MWKSVSKEGTAVEEAVKQLLPPCQIKCPINEDIQRTNVLISLLPNDEEKAHDGIIGIGDYLYEKNPFFNICGYVCGLCELECNYKSKGGAIRRRLLKRFLSDHYTEYLEKKPAFTTPKDKGKVAVIGGGPSGLQCAYTLSRRGYQVTIFEASDRLGGALWLIPPYRLPKDILKTTVENMVRIAGIEVRYNTRVGQNGTRINDLREEGFEAFYVAKGTPTPRVLTFGRDVVEGQELAGVMYGQMLLFEVSSGAINMDYFKGKKVLVIGGGNVAFDAARTARRLGGDVKIIALENPDKESRDGIPADEEEIRAAWEEGIEIIHSRGVKKIYGQGGRFTGIQCPRCTCVFDDKGFNPKFDHCDLVDIEGDILMITVGQMADKASLNKDGLLDENGRLVVDPLTKQSLEEESIFVGGDVSKIGFMVEGMAEGAQAAESISRYISGLDLRKGRKHDHEGFEIPNRKEYKKPIDVVWIPPEKRMLFQLVERGYTLKEAIDEAKRCTTCGPCVSCKACVSIGFQKSLSPVEVDENKCSGCSMCVYACNYNAASLVKTEEDIISETDLYRCKSCGMCVSACPSNARSMVDDTTDINIKKAFSSLR